MKITIPLLIKKSKKWLNEPFQNLNLQLDDLENEVYPASMTSPIDNFISIFMKIFSIL